MEILNVKNLVVNYGMIKAVKGASFFVNQGEIVALIGANGAGKTSILHTITGLLSAKDGIEGAILAHRESPELILLDVMLPKKDGFSLCRELRKDGISVPIIMLTAKGEEKDKVMGLDFGADDYMTKPFGIKELMARIRAHLRRNDSEKIEKGFKETKKLKLNEIEKEVYINNDLVNLTVKEFELLSFLMLNRGKTFSRDELLNKVWGIDYMGESRTVDVHIRHIRQKLNSVGDGEDYIETIRGRGYRIK